MIIFPGALALKHLNRLVIEDECVPFSQFTPVGSVIGQRAPISSINSSFKLLDIGVPTCMANIIMQSRSSIVRAARPLTVQTKSGDSRYAANRPRAARLAISMYMRLKFIAEV